MHEDKASHDDWDRLWQQMSEGMSKNPGRDYRYIQVVKKIRKLGFPNKRVIDLGCGTGQLLSTLDKQFDGLELVGLDVSTVGMVEAQKLVPLAKFHEILVTQGVPHLQESIEKSGIVMCSEVLEHLDYPDLTLEWIGDQLLESNGYVVITVPSGPMSFFDNFIGHRRHYSKKSLIDLLESCGFTDIFVSRSGFPGINLMRIGAIIRGERIIDDVRNFNSLGSIQKLGLTLSNLLMKVSLPDSILGWQLIATAKKSNESE
jgi:SAM-dependent methyltransferase